MAPWCGAPPPSPCNNPLATSSSETNCSFSCYLRCTKYNFAERWWVETKSATPIAELKKQPYPPPWEYFTNNLINDRATRCARPLFLADFSSSRRAGMRVGSKPGYMRENPLLRREKERRREEKGNRTILRRGRGSPPPPPPRPGGDFAEDGKKRVAFRAVIVNGGRESTSGDISRECILSVSVIYALEPGERSGRGRDNCTTRDEKAVTRVAKDDNAFVQRARNPGCRVK